MSSPITDGLELLRALRSSHTPDRWLQLGIAACEKNLHATATEVYNALQAGDAPLGTLHKAHQLMTTGELVVHQVKLHPLDQLLMQRGEVVDISLNAQPTIQPVVSVKDEVEAVKAEALTVIKEQAAEIEDLRKRLSLETENRKAAESLLDGAGKKDPLEAATKA